MTRGSIDRVRIKLQRLPHGENLALPSYQSAESAGMDLVAAIPDGKPLRIGPGKRAEIATGISLHLPLGTEGQVRPRSGLAARSGLTVLNAPGTVDSDYRGEIKVILINLGDTAVEIVRGDRIAQLVVARVTRATLIEVETLSASARGSAGFGSTGVRSSAVKKSKDLPETAPAKKTRSPSKR
jgi:dUTP pyrophosphatase